MAGLVPVYIIFIMCNIVMVVFPQSYAAQQRPQVADE